MMGPGVTGLMTSSPYIEEFTSLGIVFMLFMTGVEDKPTRVLNFRKSIAAGPTPFSFLSLFSLRPLPFCFCMLFWKPPSWP
ncbi:hypothetical protein PQ610_07100 [Tardisphaera miroshnichenkoae]